MRIRAEQTISAVIAESGPQGFTLSWSPEQIKQSRMSFGAPAEGWW